jgi:Mce-associated membrane protein
MADAGDRSQDSAKAKADAIALAEAEAAEAEALAAAARARARAIKLRRDAEAQARRADDQAADKDDRPETTEVAEAPDTTAETAEAPEAADTPAVVPTESTRGRLRVRGFARVLSAAAIITICALLGVNGWMLWHHHDVLQKRQHAAAFVAAAKQGVINLISLDFKKAKEDVQRILDSATGEFKDDFARRADDFASVIKDSKAVTEGSVAASAVESIAKDSAVVLVQANERVTNLAGAKDEPRAFRFRVSVVRDGDQLKISKLEFVI